MASIREDCFWKRTTFNKRIAKKYYIVVLKISITNLELKIGQQSLLKALFAHLYCIEFIS